jgi:2',3'-cyclic-nucleotide 2'-phosphodiesterase (5'-nucleotidase family)
MLKQLTIFFSFLFLTACSIQTFQLSSTNYKVSDYPTKDTAASRLLAPYKDSLRKSMNAVIGFSVYGLSKKQPESNIGNFMANAMMGMAMQKFNTKVDAAFVNYGGIRSYIPKGEITIGKVFELMPFDNLIVLQKISGEVLQQFLNHIASRNGWPIAGIRFGIKEKQAINVLINGEPINLTKIYTIANSDYVANGGDNCDMLKKLPQQNVNLIFRDALIEYIKQQTALGNSIDAKTENRIVYAN